MSPAHEGGRRTAEKRIRSPIPIAERRCAVTSGCARVVRSGMDGEKVLTRPQNPDAVRYHYGWYLYGSVLHVHDS